MTRAEAKEATREKVLAAARTLFQQHGYEGVGVRDVSMAIGMSIGAVYASFPDKAAMWEAAMGRAAPDVRSFLRRLAASDLGPIAVEAEALLRDVGR